MLALTTAITKQGSTFDIAKVDADKRQVFGWLSVAKNADGSTVVDLEGDTIDPGELEKAAYGYVLKYRRAGERHNKDIGTLIESVVFTAEKQKAMGIPPGHVPEGWWAGWQIDDAEAWGRVKSGEYAGLSIGARANRIPIPEAAHG